MMTINGQAVRGLSADEQTLMVDLRHWGADAYPIDKVGSRWTWSFRSICSPQVFRTKREAVASFEAYREVLREALREMRQAGWDGVVVAS